MIPKRRMFGAPPVAGGGFSSYAAGRKSYGEGHRAAPNVGAVDNAQAAAGYQQRDRLNEAKRNALRRRIGGI